MKKILFIFSIILMLSTQTSIAQQGTLLQETLLHASYINDPTNLVTRQYTLYIPANYTGTEKVPLLFNFHGGGGTGQGQLFMSDMRPIADTAGFIIVYPTALPDPSGECSACWTHKEPSTINDIFFVEEMINTIALDYQIDLDRVYTTGYSNGGEFSFVLACQLSDKIAAVTSIARSMYEPVYSTCAPSHPTAVMTIHGTLDEYNGIIFGGVTYYLGLDDVNTYWANYNNTDIAPIITNIGTQTEHYRWENGDGCVSVEHFKVNGGGHDWPGSFGTNDIVSDIEIWNFVSRFDINGLIDCNSSSINDNNEKDLDIELYPNPTKNSLTINTDLSNSLEYEIYSVLGSFISSGKIEANNNTINLSNLPPNVYLLKINNNTFKIIRNN